MRYDKWEYYLTTAPIELEGESKMAILRKDGKAVKLSRGLYSGDIKDFKYRGLKKTKKGDVFECGNLENGVYLSQYIMVTPYNKYLFYKFVKAVGLEHKIDEYIDFPFYEMFDKEIVLELDYESIKEGRYLNVINVYSLEEAEEFIQYQKARDELKRRNGMLDMNFIEMMNERRAEIASKFNNTKEVEVNEIRLDDEYEELIGD